MGTAKPEHVQKAQAEGKLFPYANHNPDYQVGLDAVALGTQIGVASLMTYLVR